jgi:uncharacterized coiled-coil protein SlyX
MALWTEEMLDALADRMSQSSESAIRSQERLARSEEILASSEERLAATNDALAEGRVSLELTKKLSNLMLVVMKLVVMRSLPQALKLRN